MNMLGASEGRVKYDIENIRFLSTMFFHLYACVKRVVIAVTLVQCYSFMELALYFNILMYAFVVIKCYCDGAI